MSKTTAKKLVVCGGNGFLGSRICKYAVARGWDVTSISRSGEPTWSNVTSSPSPPSWAHKVTWERADIFQPTSYAPLLANADYVVHSMGILLEADYKGVLTGQQSPLAGLRKAFAPDKRRDSPNPLERRDGGGGGGAATPADRPPEPDHPQQQQQQQQQQQLTYEAMNRDSAVLLARAAGAAGAEALLYVSAAGGAPVLPARYLATKRAAEALIAEAAARAQAPAAAPAQAQVPEAPRRAVFVRAPLLYDASRWLTLPLAALAGAGALLNGAARGALAGVLGAAGAKPLPADAVARAAVEALEAGVSGPVEVPELEALAEKAWRKGMS